jgi:hypothetical protein
MGILPKDYILAVWHGTDPNAELVCAECLIKEEWDNISLDTALVTEGNRDDDTLYFCDRCKKQIIAQVIDGFIRDGEFTPRLIC